ncbi:MAG: protein phosphatase 2C domain-containing protein [Agathobacter sp.]|nr:protein phosphatase 2C domain-containing protein [Agathobacter sp.]
MKLFQWIKGPGKSKLPYLAANLQGIGSRNRQEDSFAFANVFDAEQIEKKGLLFVVADGMGGMRDGKIASDTAVYSIKNDFEKMDRSADLGEQLVQSTFRASSFVEERLDGYGGSTLIAGILYEKKLYYASVGDSFLYLMRDNQLIRINSSHNLENQMYLENIMDGGFDPDSADDSEAAALTQFLGMVGMSEVDSFVTPFQMQDRDIILACSDGVAGVITEPLILECLRNDEPQQMCMALEKEILNQRRGNQDNYTALIIQCTF